MVFLLKPHGVVALRIRLSLRDDLKASSLFAPGEPAIAQREAHAAERAMREHLEQVRDGLLKVMTSPLPDQRDERISDTPVTANIKKEIRHGT